jgi:hypothetical protein
MFIRYTPDALSTPTGCSYVPSDSLRSEYSPAGSVLQTSCSKCMATLDQYCRAGSTTDITHQGTFCSTLCPHAAQESSNSVAGCSRLAPPKPPALTGPPSTPPTSPRIPSTAPQLETGPEINLPSASEIEPVPGSNLATAVVVETMPDSRQRRSGWRRAVHVIPSRAVHVIPSQRSTP